MLFPKTDFMRNSSTTLQGCRYLHLLFVTKFENVGFSLTVYSKRKHTPNFTVGAHEVLGTEPKTIHNICYRNITKCKLIFARLTTNFEKCYNSPKWPWTDYMGYYIWGEE